MFQIIVSIASVIQFATRRTYTIGCLVYLVSIYTYYITYIKPTNLVWQIDTLGNGSSEVVLASLSEQYSCTIPSSHHACSPIYLSFSILLLRHGLASLATQYHLHSSVIYSSCTKPWDWQTLDKWYNFLGASGHQKKDFETICYCMYIILCPIMSFWIVPFIQSYSQLI